EPAVDGLREDDGAVEIRLDLLAADAVSPDGIDVAVAGARRVAVDGDVRQAPAGADGRTRVRVEHADRPLGGHFDRLRPGRPMVCRALHLDVESGGVLA